MNANFLEVNFVIYITKSIRLTYTLAPNYLFQKNNSQEMRRMYKYLSRWIIYVGSILYAS